MQSIRLEAGDDLVVEVWPSLPSPPEDFPAIAVVKRESLPDNLVVIRPGEVRALAKALHDAAELFASSTASRDVCV